MLLPLLVFAPMLLGILAYAVGRKSKPLRTVLVILTCAAAFGGTLLLWGEEHVFTWEGFCGMGIHLRADGFRSFYASVAAFMWLGTALLSPQYFAHYHNRGRYFLFNLITLGATLGVLYSDDLYTTLIFFEIMSLTSYTWVAHEETPGAMRAAQTYLAVAIIGGLTTLMGLFLLWHSLGTLSFEGMRATLAERGGPDGTVTVGAWLTLFGFAAKAGLFPIHIWLPKAHPVAPAPASALLSGILTKTGIFGMIVVTTRLMGGVEAFVVPLTILGAVTMSLGAVMALFSVDLKRTLACSSVSQIGFITVGLGVMNLLGEEGGLAAYGAVEHMLNHSLIKLCLFMCAGVVYMNLHQLNLNDIRGYGRGKWVLHICFLLGALSIGCIPPIGSGFNSKSLLHEGILEYIAHLQAHGLPWGWWKALELLFIFSGGLTIAYMTKLYVCLFIEKHPTRQAEFDAKKRTYLKPLSAIALIASAVILPVLGICGARILSPLASRSMPFFGQEALHHEIHYFSGENLLGAGYSIAVGALVYAFVVRKWLMKRGENGVKEYINRWPARLDMENSLYRPLLGALTAFFGAVFGFFAAIPDSHPVRAVGRGIGKVTAFIGAIPDSAAVLKGFPAAVTAFVRALSELPERGVMFLRETLFSPPRHHEAPPVGTRFTWGMGRWLDHLATKLNGGLMRSHPMHEDYEFRLAETHEELRDETGRVGRSFSFGLLLLAIGLLLTVLYLVLF